MPRAIIHFDSYLVKESWFACCHAEGFIMFNLLAISDEQQAFVMIAVIILTFLAIVVSGDWKPNFDNWNEPPRLI